MLARYFKKKLINCFINKNNRLFAGDYFYVFKIQRVNFGRDFGIITTLFTKERQMKIDYQEPSKDLLMRIDIHEK